MNSEKAATATRTNSVELSVRLDVGDRDPAQAFKSYIERGHALVGQFLRDLPEAPGGKVQVERIHVVVRG